MANSIVTKGLGPPGSIAEFLLRGLNIGAAYVPTFSLRNTLQDLRSAVLATGYVSDCDIGGPKQITGDRVYASITLRSTSTPEVSLGTTHDYYIVQVRFYRDAFAEPTSDVERDLAQAVSQSWVNILADYDAGGTIRNVDVAGTYGQSMSARWGHEGVSGKMYRVADVTLPLIVDDIATLVQ